MAVVAVVGVVGVAGDRSGMIATIVEVTGSLSAKSTESPLNIESPEKRGT